MDNSKEAFCLIKLFSSSVEDFGNLTFGGSLRACCPQQKAPHRAGKLIAHSAEEGSSGSVIVEEKCRPIIYLEGVREWNADESLYTIGLSAWHLIKPYVSFFSHDLSVKVGTGSPYIVHSPLGRKYLVWHMMEGFPHEEKGVAFEKTNKVWLRIPTRCHKPFQSLVMGVFGLHVYKTFCTPHCGESDFGSWNFKVNVPSSRILFGVECDEAAAAFFVGLAGFGDIASKQFISNFIIEPNDTEVETDAAGLASSNCPANEVDRTEALEVVEEPSIPVIKEEIKEEPEPGPEEMPHTQLRPQSGNQKNPAVLTVKCPGCSISFHGGKSGLDALSHHIINSHRRHAKVYRHSLRFRAQKGPDRRSSLMKRENCAM